MYITFKNTGEEHIFLHVGNRPVTLEPKASVEIPLFGDKISFITQVVPVDLIKDIEEEDYKPEKFKDKILYKLAKIFAKTMPDMALYTSVTYELSNIVGDTTIELNEAMYANFTGVIAELFDMFDVLHYFVKAEVTTGSLKVIKAVSTNRKKYLKLYRNLLLFLHWGLILPNLTLFIPKYILAKCFSSGFFMKILLKKLYAFSPQARKTALEKNNEKIDEPGTGKGCLKTVVILVLFLLILSGLCHWADSSDPNVVINKNFNEVVCFDETFERIEGKLPEDAEAVFFEHYSAYYPMADGEYDEDTYYCYIYETPSGERYMWLKTDCSNEENYDKEYEDYENPVVYKSVGEIE